MRAGAGGYLAQAHFHRVAGNDDLLRQVNMGGHAAEQVHARQLGRPQVFGVQYMFVDIGPSWKSGTVTEVKVASYPRRPTNCLEQDRLSRLQVLQPGKHVLGAACSDRGRTGVDTNRDAQSADTTRSNKQKALDPTDQSAQTKSLSCRTTSTLCVTLPGVDGGEGKALVDGPIR